MAGYEIDVYREIPEDEEDIEIGEFADEFKEETIQKLRDIGCDTAKAVLELSVDELIRRTGLEREIAERLVHAIKVEFDEEEPYPGEVRTLAPAPVVEDRPSAEELAAALDPLTGDERDEGEEGDPIEAVEPADGSAKTEELGTADTEADEADAGDLAATTYGSAAEEASEPVEPETAAPPSGEKQEQDKAEA